MMTQKLDAREIARLVLIRVRRDDAYATLALDGLLDSAKTSEDKALATELSYGVLRRREQLDRVLSLFMDLSSIDEDLIDVLRIASYQLLFLDRVPAYAAVNEAVDRIRKLRNKHIAGVANAVLRKINKETLQSIEPKSEVKTKAEEIDAISVAGSFPRYLARLFRKDLGFEEAMRFAVSNLDPAPFTLRTNITRITRDDLIQELSKEGAVVCAATYSPAGIYLDTRASKTFRIQTSDAYHTGLFSVQDEAAQLVSYFADPKPGMRVLDACCGLGGKTLHLAEILASQGVDTRDMLLGVDINRRKLELFEENRLRLGLECQSRYVDLLDGKLGESFDLIILDAPCSGLGVLRRHPEMKWRSHKKRDSVDDLVLLQRKLVTSAIESLKPGGRLVFSLCTVTKKEGPNQRDWMLEQFPQMELENLSAAIENAPFLCENEMRLWPHIHGCDGFYALRLKRES